MGRLVFQLCSGRVKRVGGEVWGEEGGAPLSCEGHWTKEAFQIRQPVRWEPVETSRFGKLDDKFGYLWDIHLEIEIGASSATEGSGNLRCE